MFCFYECTCTRNKHVVKNWIQLFKIARRPEGDNLKGVESPDLSWTKSLGQTINQTAAIDRDPGNQNHMVQGAPRCLFVFAKLMGAN